MNFKQFSTSDNQWHDIPYYQHKTATDTLSLPATLYPNDTSITVGIKGNTVQNGTPTPDSPIMPQGIGERTAQLYFKKIVSGSIGADGGIVANASFDCYVAKVEANQQYIGTGYVYAFYTSEPALGSVSYNGQRTASSVVNGFTSPIDGYVAVRHNADVTDAMLNSGSTPLPYEPYGYKIPILSANTTTPVYLGEVESTRKVAKYEFTGQEADLRIQAAITATDAIQLPTTQSDYKREPFICSHMPVTSSSTTTSTHGFYGQFLTLCFEKSMGLDTLEKMRTYLQQQYAAGTPVCVWYVLATSETAVVNEPLMRIGEYADTVGNISIPVTAGGDTLSVSTTVQPSEVTVNYKGWHPVADVHERDNGAWT